ncbi:ankyrin repeat domain-containing protein [Chitinophaga sp. Cy-1792]|uniref:ankyrin repeat domain-containing protein n=1 Tax=Chitinophaga sp. Cy-1792 TaxID=2608339 RepID=UPI0014224392|nr:ankyrin repeat domain-containing protein [Chitinophaga sp. Cy-1792]NIG54052.1 hypothetical protein [Chitinophaga sp. Cy-1792]
MATKRKTLPKDFEEQLKTKSLQELTAIFDQCSLEATGGYNKQTALAFDGCPHELAAWLIQQGADLHTPDLYGNTPLHNRAGSHFGNIESLITLGADVNANPDSNGTPLHAAAQAHNAKNTTILLQHGAIATLVNKSGQTPLEVALNTCNNIDIIHTASISRNYLEAGIKITEEMKAAVSRIGERFEFHRAKFNRESVEEHSNALQELYVLFGTKPIPKRILHDGISPITTTATTWQKQHEELWTLLVPSSGAADSIQGEVIRITGRIGNELEGNGGINWDADFKKMAQALNDYLSQGTPLSPAELTETQALVEQVIKKSGNTARLSELAVNWVKSNPTPLRLPNVSYKR